jgi:hypothetical protein
MINPHWLVVDLDPRTWRALGRFSEPSQYIQAAQPGEHGLFILHEDGRLLRIVDTQQGLRTDIDITAVEDPRLLARQLYQTGEWQRVHVINKHHLATVAAQAQATPRRDLHLDEYYYLVYRLMWGNADGYVSVPPKSDNWNGWRLGDIKAFVESLPAECTLTLGVLDQGRVAIGLIVVLHQGVVDCVTTFEALDLPKDNLHVCPELMETIWQQLDQKFTPPAAVFLCTPAVFEEWLAAGDKRLVIQQAEDAGTALLAVWRQLETDV